MPGQRFAFGPFVLDSEAGTLLRDGAPLNLGYRGFLLLTAFLNRPGEVLTKSDLFDAAWLGAVVEETNLSVQIASLRKHLGHSPTGGEWIATIPRVGYRFVGTVDRRTDGLDGNAGSPAAKEPVSGPSIAVLPFVNLSDDREQEYFADGIVEDIIAGLSRLRWLFVIARNSTYAYKGKSPDVRQVALDLGVRYVLEGSVRRAGPRVRVTAELVDGPSSRQVWAERYDRELTDIFAVQDEITASVVASIEPHLFAAEGASYRRKVPGSLDAWGLVMRAMPTVWTWAGPDNDAALRDLNQAVAIDPGYTHAYSLIAWTHASRAHMGLVRLPEVLEQATGAARRAIELDGQDPWGHLALGYVHMLARRFRPAVEELTQAIDLNPSFALARGILGAAFGFGGEPDLGLEHLRIARRLSPRDAQQAIFLSAEAICHFVAGHYAESADLNRRAVQLRPLFVSAWRSLAAAASLAGDSDTAAAALAEARNRQPELSAEWIEESYALVRREDRALYIEGLRKAGLN
jgi:TolB-like protein/Tfp pilus assembly protein PilF